MDRRSFLMILITSISYYSCGVKNNELETIFDAIKDKMPNHSLDNILREIYIKLYQDTKENFYSEGELKNIFESLKDKNALLIIMEREFGNFLKGINHLNRLSKEGKNITILDIWEHVISKFVNMYCVYLYSLHVYSNKNYNQKYNDNYDSNSKYISNISLFPGNILHYTHQGYCMNKTLGAPTSGDMLILKNISNLSISTELKQIIKCIVKNYKRLENPQGLIWFILDLSKVNLLSFNVKISELDKVIQICPESRDILARYLVKKITFDILNKFVEFSLNINGKKYNIIELYNDPYYANKLIEDLIKIGNRDKSIQGFGYSTIDDNVFSRSIGLSPLVAKIDILNMKPTTYEVNLDDYYLHPISNKQRISPPYDIKHLDIIIPRVNQDTLQKIEKVFCKALNILLDEIFDSYNKIEEKNIPEKSMSKYMLKSVKNFSLKNINFVLNLSEFILGKEIIGCKELECSERVERLLENILGIGITEITKLKMLFNTKSVIGKVIAEIILENLSNFLSGNLSIACEKLPKINGKFCIEIPEGILKESINCVLGRV